LAAIKNKIKTVINYEQNQKTNILIYHFSLILISITNLRAQNSRDSIPLTKVINQWTEELSNWGRWGEDDELGTSNLITAQNRKATSLVTERISVSCPRIFLKNWTR
jgi:hypothetical protein